MNETNNVGSSSKIYCIGIEKIINNELNKVYKVQDLEELKTSIEQFGLKQPLCVVKEDDHYKLIAGHRRLAAIKEIFADNKKIMFGNKELMNQVPCIFENTYEDEDEEFINLIQSNIYRKKTKEEIKEVVLKCNEIYQKNKEQGKVQGKKRDVIAKMAGVSARTVDSFLKDESEEKEFKIQSINSVLNKLEKVKEILSEIDMEEYGKTDRNKIRSSLDEINELIKKKK